MDAKLPSHLAHLKRRSLLSTASRLRANSFHISFRQLPVQQFSTRDILGYEARRRATIHMLCCRHSIHLHTTLKIFSYRLYRAPKSSKPPNYAIEPPLSLITCPLRCVRMSWINWEDQGHTVDPFTISGGQKCYDSGDILREADPLQWAHSGDTLLDLFDRPAGISSWSIVPSISAQS